jgi:hypothetical protein
MKVYTNEIDGKIDRVEDYVQVRKILKKTKAYVKSTVKHRDVHFFEQTHLNNKKTKR